VQNLYNASDFPWRERFLYCLLLKKENENKISPGGETRERVYPRRKFTLKIPHTMAALALLAYFYSL
jgi:hypothetical protein